MKHKLGLDGRARKLDGTDWPKRRDTLVGTLREIYGEQFAKGFRSDMELGTLLDKFGVEHLNGLKKIKPEWFS